MAEGKRRRKRTWMGKREKRQTEGIREEGRKAMDLEDGEEWNKRMRKGGI